MKGIYVLIIKVSKNIKVNVGALGPIFFEKGLYAYVGSAQNSLEKRIKRHFRKEKRKFWHIDYLLANENVKIVKVFYKKAGKTEECKTAKKIMKKGKPIKGFGSSDSECKSHLIKIKSYQFLREGMCEMTFTEGGWCVWITGLPGSGKSVVSEALLKLLEEEGIHVQLLASDNLRKVLTPKPTYSLNERDIVYATLVYIAKLLTSNGVNVIIDATGNLRRYRENARKQIPKFMEVYLKCPLEICIKRETQRKNTRSAPKQIYKRAFEGKAPTVPGIGQPYEPPINPEITINTVKYTPEQAAEKILEKIRSLFYI